MKFTCTNLRKTATLEYTNDCLQFMGNKLPTKRVYFFPASLTNEHAQLFVLVDGLYQKKEFLHFKSQSWLTGISDDTEDQMAVDCLNIEAEHLVSAVACDKDLTVPARVHKTANMSPIVFREGEVLSAEALYYRETKNIEVIFCERVTSYTKTFDLTFVLKGGKVETHSCVDRKCLRDIGTWAETNTIEFYHTGPDPLPWKQMFSYHKDQSWKEINDLLNRVSSEEDDGSDWEEGLTDSEEEEDIEDYIDSEEEEDYPSDISESSDEEDYAFKGKNKRVLSDSDDPPPKRGCLKY